MAPARMTASNRVAMLLCLVLLGGCAHGVVPHASQPAAETQPNGKNPVIIAMPPIPSGEPKVVIHEPGVDLSTSNVLLGVALAVVLFLVK